MAGRLIGDAYIVVYPQTDGFPAQLEAAVKKATTALKPTVNVRPEVDKAGAAAVKAQLDALDTAVTVTPRVDTASAAAAREALEKSFGDLGISAHLDAASLAKVEAELKAQLSAFQSGATGLHTDLSVGTKIDPAALAAAKTSLQAYLDHNMVTAPVGTKVDPASLAAMKGSIDAYLKGVGTADVGVRIDPVSLAAARASLDAYLKDDAVKITADDAQAIADLADLMERAVVLQGQLRSLKADVDDSSAARKLTALGIQAAALSSSLNRVGAGNDLTAFEATLAGISQKFEDVKASVTDADGEIKQSIGLFASLGLQGPGSLIHITDILNASLPEIKLFGGAIGDLYRTMSGDELPAFASHLVNVATSAHLTTEAAVEFAAVWGPALIAVTAFGAAASPTVIAIGKQLTNMNTAAKGTGDAFQSLATRGESVTAAVKPSVMEAFGIALYAVQNHSSGLSDAMKTLGSDIDQMAAKAAVAFDKSSGTFFTQGTKDANALMQSFESLGSIIGTLFKAVPGYAEVLLNFGNALLSVAATGTKFAEPIIAEFLKLHGALLYGGLTGTAAAWVFPKIVDAAASAAGGVANAAAKILGDENKITVGAGKLLTGLEDISGGPVIAGVGLLAGAIAAVVIYLKASKDAADSFNSSIQTSVKNATTLQLMSTIQSGLTQTTIQYVDAQKQLTQATKNLTGTGQAAAAVGTARLGQIRDEQRAVANDTDTTNQYKDAVAQLTSEQQNANTNLQAIASTFHTTLPGAIAIANGAQITSSQLTAKGADNWATIKAQAGGYVTQLNVMTAGTGTLNQALNALNVTQSAQITDAQKLASAYSTWIGIVTSGESGFTSFEQGFIELNGAMSKNQADAVTLYAKTGQLKDKYAEFGATLDGTTQASIAARQAWDAQISTATTLYGNLQTMAAASGNTATAQTALAKAGKDVIAQLLPLAAGSKEATAEVFALAQIAGYGGVDSFQGLAKWIGTTKGAEADLDTQQTILTLSTANLTAAAKNLATAVGSEITAAEAQAISKTDNFQQATLNLSNAINQSNGQATAAVQTYAGQYYEALIKAGVGATTARQDVDAFLTQLGTTSSVVNTVNAALASLPKNTNMTVTMSGNGYYTITENGQNFQISQGGLNSPHAAGGYIAAGTGPTADDVPIRVSRGEYVVKAASVAKYGTGMLHDINEGKFASGGPVGADSVAALGPYAKNMYANFQSQFAQSMVSAMTTSLKSSEASALSAAQISLAGVSNASALTALQSAAAKAGWTGAQWTALYDVEMREAGFNLAATNPSSGAYGLAQFIDGPSEYAQYGGNSTTAAGQAVAMINYIKSRYGTPENAWSHEQNYGWYSGGGEVKPHSAGGMISEPVLGRGVYSGIPYSFAEKGPEQVIAGGAARQGGSHMQGMSSYQGQQLIALLQQTVKQGQQMPYAFAQGLNQANAAGVRRGYFATSG